MSDQVVAAGGAAPSFLPPAVAQRAARDDAREAIAARHAEEEREAYLEELRQRHLTLYAEQAAARGDVLDVMALARGEARGRTVGDVLDAARAQGDAEDRRTALMAHRNGHGEPEKLHVEFADPVIHAPAARSANAMKIFNRARKFRDLLEARRQLAAAEKAAEASKYDHGLVDGVTSRSRRDDVVVVSPSRRAALTCRTDPYYICPVHGIRHGVSGVSYR